MGYVQPQGLIDQLQSPNAEIRKAAAREMLDGYERYKAGMRSGLFGLLLGRWLFPAGNPSEMRETSTSPDR